MDGPSLSAYNDEPRSKLTDDVDKSDIMEYQKTKFCFSCSKAILDYIDIAAILPKSYCYVSFFSCLNS